MVMSINCPMLQRIMKHAHPLVTFYGQNRMFNIEPKTEYFDVIEKQCLM